MINLSNFKSIATRAIGRGGLILSKHSPEILMGVGIVSIIAATYKACTATLELDNVTSFYQKDINHIKRVKGTTPEYTNDAGNRDLARTYIKRTVHVVKLYLPAIALGTFGITCLIGSHYILKKRNIALMAAYKVVDESFKKYRKNVEENYVEKESTATNEVVMADGSKKVISRMSPSMESPYARWYDENSPEFVNDYFSNVVFLQAKQSFANDILRTRGHFFLNEAYDMLGIPRSKEGNIVGWVSNGDGDDYIEFDIFNASNLPGIDPETGYSRAFFLDFNVDGIMYDKI